MNTITNACIKKCVQLLTPVNKEGFQMHGTRGLKFNSMTHRSQISPLHSYLPDPLFIGRQKQMAQTPYCMASD